MSPPFEFNGVPVDIDEYMAEVVAKMPPLTETQKVIIRALFNVNGDEPEVESQRRAER
jgi:hypothetical protein